MKDQRGLPLECRTPEAAAALETAIEELLAWRDGVAAAVGRAVAADRRAALAQVVGAYDLLCQPPPDQPERLREALARAGEGRSGPRGRAHLTAARAWAAGRPDAAVAALEAWLLEAPQDLLALAMAQRLYQGLGEAESLRDAPARLFDAWDAATPGYGQLLAAHAWGLAETGALAEAEEAGVQALAREPDTPLAVLAVAAALEQGGRLAEAQEWLALQETVWRPAERLAPQIQGYLALLQVDRGAVTAALARYDEALAPGCAGPARLIDAGGLLWRLELVGAETGGRWAPLLEGWGAVAAVTRAPLAAVHAVMAAAAGGDARALAEAQARLDALAEGADQRGAVLRAVGRPLADALVAFAQHRPAAAADGLLALRGRWAALGGSRAQRDLFEQTLIYAALVAGRHRLARALLSARRCRRPASPQTWQASAATFEALGESAAAAAALARVRALLAA